jgi:hypothetical protein
VTIEWRGSQAKAAIRRGGGRGVERVADLVGQTSQEVVPRESEELARSMVVDVDHVDMEASVSYDTDYAVINHEKRRRHARGETDKYLERPLNAAARTGAAADLMAESIRQELEQ